MKKILFSMLAVAAIASCAKTEPTYVEADSEIKLNPVTTVATKANQLKAITGATYPAAEAFDVYAYWLDDAGTLMETPYLTGEGSGVEFVNKGNYWGGKTTYYWPKNGSLRFAAYSPSSLDMTHDYATDTYTLDSHVYPAADVTVDAANYTANTYDILVAPMSEGYTAETGASKVSVKFEHALSWLTFKLQSTEVANEAFTVTKVVVNDVVNKGTLVADMDGDKGWTPDENVKTDVNVSTQSYTVTSNAAVREDVGNGFLVLPQKPTTVTVYYTQNALEGTPALDNQKITVSLVLDKADDKWEPGKHYTYTVLFDLDEILINPSVEDWEETAEVIVNSDPVSVATASELVAAVAEGKDVVLEQNITLDEPVVVAPVETKAGEATVEVTIDLNGKTITNQVGNEQTDVIIVEAGATLTLNGEGTVEAVTGNDGYAVIAKGTVVINGGTYKSGVDAAGAPNAVVYARDNGKVYVNGGIFPNDDASKYVLNKKDADRDNTVIEVTGGTFYNFNPGDNAAEGPGTNFVAPGYASTETATGVWTVAPAAPTEVTTAAELAEVVGNGGTAVLANDITLSEILVMSYDAVLDGNGYTLTSSAARAINVVEGKNVTIKNLNIVASGERAINIITNTKNVSVENVTATAANYTVNVAASASKVNVKVVNSDLTGLNVVNVAGAGAVVNVVDTKITCNDKNDKESYKAVTVNKEGENASITVTGGEVVVLDDSWGASQEAPGSSVIFVGTKGTTTIKDVYYAVEYGDYYYSFGTFADALDHVKDGQTIVLTQDVTIESHLNITKSVNLDFNGNTLFVDTAAADGGEGDDAIWVRDYANVVITNGTIKFVSIGETYASGVFATGSSNVTIDNVNIEAGGEAVYAQAHAQVVINGGSFKSVDTPDFTINLRDKTSKPDDTATITVKGGSYYKFNPADNAAEGAGTNFVADGYKVLVDGDWYNVVAE